MNYDLELLAPVGSFESLKAAINNGADAIYVGGPSFGARVTAAFSREELIEIIHSAHLYNVRVYVTLNTTIFSEEMTNIVDYIHFLYKIDTDSVIVSDLGIAKLVREMYPDFEIHFSTQAHIHNSRGVELAKELGATRIVAARENSIKEIEKMCAHGIDVEVFVHGALCFAYSGQCLLSSNNGGRSGNRGACAQPCRLPYELINVKTEKTLPNIDGDYLLSPRDLKTIDEIGILIETGVRSFKIEGRLKSPEYVATVVKAYRKAIDNYLETGAVNTSDITNEGLLQVFNRQFTNGFLHGETGRNWIGSKRAGHRGVKIGRIIDATGNRATVKLTKTLNLHDGIRVVGADEFGMQVQKMFVNKNDVKVANPGFVDLICNFIPAVGMEVYRTTSAVLTKQFEETSFEKIKIDGVVTMKYGTPLTLEINDALGNKVMAKSEEIVDLAQNKNIDEQRLRQQISKTGNTPFEFENVLVNMDDNVTIPISSINNLRRVALIELEEKRKMINAHRVVRVNQPQLPAANHPDKSPILTVSVRTIEQLEAVCETKYIKTIYYQDYPTIKQAIELANSHGIKIIAHLPRVMNDTLLTATIKKCKTLGITAVLSGELGTLGAFKNDFTVFTDYSLNINNEWSLASLSELGVTRATLSYEMNNSQIKQIAKNKNMDLEIVAYGKIPLMITKHCPLKTHYQEDGKVCHGNYCQTPHVLKDRKGKLLPLVKTSDCKIEIFSDQTMNLFSVVNELKNNGINHFRLDFTNETTSEIKQVIDAFAQKLTGVKVEKLSLKNADFTMGHYHKGVL